jgi:hypothetical protein
MDRTPPREAPGYLVVVRADRPGDAEALRRRFHAMPEVEVVSERRVRDRRTRRMTPVHPEQRRGPRRRSPPWTPLAYIIPKQHGMDPIPVGTVAEAETALRRLLQG